MTIHGNGDHLIDLFLILAEIPFPSLPMIKANLPAVFHWLRWRAVHVGPKDPEAFFLELV